MFSFTTILNKKKNQVHFRFTVSMFHNIIITVISSEKSSCSYHLEIIFQEFPAVIILQLWQFN